MADAVIKDSGFSVVKDIASAICFVELILLSYNSFLYFSDHLFPAIEAPARLIIDFAPLIRLTNSSGECLLNSCICILSLLSNVFFAFS